MMVRPAMQCDADTGLLGQHDALRVRGRGASRAAAFESAALALSAAMTEPAAIRPLVAVSIDCEAPSDEALLLDWLNAVIYQMAARRLVFGRYRVRIDGVALHATAWGEPVAAERHDPAVAPTGAVTRALRIERGGDGKWLAECGIAI